MTALAIAPNGVQMPLLSNVIDEWFGNDFMKSNHDKLPATNMIEYDDRFVIELSVPGYQKKDFSIELNKGTLTISSKKTEETDKAEGRMRLRGFSKSQFSRSFNLADSIDTDNISASCENGILSIELPKKDEAKTKPPRSIEIK